MKRFSRAKVINCCLEKGQRNKFVPWCFFSLKKRLKNKFIMSISFSLCAKRNVKKFNMKRISRAKVINCYLEKGQRNKFVPLFFFSLKKRLKNKFILSISFSLCAKRNVKKINMKRFSRAKVIN